MKIQTFKNGKGLIYGSDPKRITADKIGTLIIGSNTISVSPDTEEILPVLFNGSTGEHKAIFTTELGNVYELGKVSVRGGRIVPPSQNVVEMMELRIRAEALEAECEALREEVRNLRNIFDTNSLNFLI